MYELLVWATGLLCLIAFVAAYAKYRDVFHPMILLPPMCAFIYVYMPLHLLKTKELFTFLSEGQVTFVQVVVLATLGALFAGCFVGSAPRATDVYLRPIPADPWTLRKGAMVLGFFGLLCWGVTIKNAGGFTGAFGYAYGAGYSEFGYVREAVYLLIIALLLLLSPECFRIRDRKWYIAVIVLSIPWLMQGLLGARRGPTFMITVTLGMSWFMARGKRPSIIALAVAGLGVGLLMLFLVTNRGKIYLGSDFKGMKTDVSQIAEEATPANEYIFGAGCITVTRDTGKFYWGRRYLAEVIVRPIPRQIWPNKYWDFGIGELQWNAGVAVDGLQTELGWDAIPGAAAAMVADMWVEFSWLEVLVAFLLGVAYGRTWRRANIQGGFWNTQFIILVLLSIYLVTQSGEAVIFRMVILSVPTAFIWRRATRSAATVPAFQYT